MPQRQPHQVRIFDSHPYFASQNAACGRCTQVAAEVHTCELCPHPERHQERNFSGAGVTAARLLAQIHDELLFEVPHGRVGETAAAVRHVMEGEGRQHMLSWSCAAADDPGCDART